MSEEKINVEKIVDKLIEQIKMPKWMNMLHSAAMDNTLREDIRKRAEKASSMNRESLIEEIVRLQYKRDELRKSLPSAEY